MAGYIVVFLVFICKVYYYMVLTIYKSCNVAKCVLFLLLFIIDPVVVARNLYYALFIYGV
jgi:hypothetical protein